MRTYLFCIAMALTTGAYADDLARVGQLLDAKSYSEAVPILNRMAAAGDAGAKLRLGELYWYGEGVSLDRARGDALFAEAAAAGNKDAQQALNLSRVREQRRADIEYWTAGYDGADLTSGKYSCQAPVIPVRSISNKEIGAVHASFNAWKICYNGLLDNISGSFPVGKRIPGDVAEVMSNQEIDAAKANLDKVYSQVVARTRAGADKTVADYAAWEKSTAAYVKEQNDLAEVREKARLAERQITMRPPVEVPRRIVLP